MRRFELGMSLDYVANWNIVDAVREIFQNCLDEEIQNPENKWYFSYDEENETIRVGNKQSALSTKSLLLGVSSKRNDDTTIGQHGEGYKVATIVLLRNHCGFKIYNYNEKEVWTAKIIKSKRYGTDIGIFDIEPLGVFKKAPENNLIFEITNITSEMYEEIKDKNLWLQDDLGQTLESESYGRVLLDEKFTGRVYVKGLYVCNNSNLHYGYDLSPSLIKLDRDRGLIDSFNLQWSLGKLIISTHDKEFIKKVKSLWDGYYVYIYFESSRKIMDEICDEDYNDFVSEYGKDAYIVEDSRGFNRLKKQGYNVVLLTSQESRYITKSSKYAPVLTEKTTDITNVVDDWFERCKTYLPEDLYNEGLEIIEELKQYV